MRVTVWFLFMAVCACFFTACATDAATKLPTISRVSNSSTSDSDTVLLQQNVVLVMQSLQQLWDLRELVDKGKNPRTYLTLDERDQVLRPWAQFANSVTVLNRLAHHYQKSAPDAETCLAQGCVEAFLLGRVAGLASLYFSAQLINLVGNAPALTLLLNEPREALTLPSGRYLAIQKSVRAQFDTSNVQRTSQELVAVSSQFDASKAAAADRSSWILNFWQHHRDDIVEAAPRTDWFRTWVVDDVQQPGQDALLNIERDIIKKVAVWLGNTRIYRKGKHAIVLPQIETMLTRLEPGDIVLEKTNWYLCNLFIDGFWGHSVLYLGSFDEATRYFDTPEINAHYQALGFQGFADYVRARFPAAVKAWSQPNERDAKPVRVIEGDGVAKRIVLNSAHDAFAGDYVAALRPHQLSKLDKAQAVADALSYWRVEYDFDFDLLTESSLVCTELIARAYASGQGKRGLRFDVDQISRGHYMIYPNKIARQYGAERGTATQQLDFVYLLRANHDESRAYVGREQEFVGSPDWKAGLKPF